MIERLVTVRIHQPLWGGFPMHWVIGPLSSPSLTTDETKADTYNLEDAMKIEQILRELYSNAVIYFK